MNYNFFDENPTTNNKNIDNIIRNCTDKDRN